jgi:hypothetical protein
LTYGTAETADVLPIHTLPSEFGVEWDHRLFNIFLSFKLELAFIPLGKWWSHASQNKSRCQVGAQLVMLAHLQGGGTAGNVERLILKFGYKTKRLNSF